LTTNSAMTSDSAAGEQATFGAFTTGGGHALKGYIDVLRRRWRIALFFTLAVPIVALGLTLREKPLYQAEALVVLSREDLAATLTGTVSTAPTGTDFSRLAQTDATVAESPAVVQQALNKLHLRRSPEAVLAHSSVTTSPANDLLTFAVTDGDSGTAIALVNAYAGAYTEYQTRLDTASLVNAEQGIARQIAQLRRSHTTLPAQLLSRQSELKVLQALQASNTAVARTAAHASKVRPTPVRNAILALVFGAILGIAAAFVREALDSRIRDEHEVAQTLGRPILGHLPFSSRQRRGRTQMVAALADPNGEDAEAFRVLNVGLGYSMVLSEARMIMIASGCAGEGKSTVSANLAVTLARSGKRVILAELDLRKPTQAQILNIEPRQPGLTDVIFSRRDLADVLIPVALQAQAAPGTNHTAPPMVIGNGSLRVLLSGSTPPSVGELLTSTLIPPVLEELRGMSDIVIVDTPPSIGLGDVTALAKHVDAVLAVVRLDMMRRTSLGTFGELLRSLPTTVLGAVVVGRFGYGEYGYGYGYGKSGDVTEQLVEVKAPAESLS
jgi:succinoglycan biosynthesis transport protein ExoP